MEEYIKIYERHFNNDNRNDFTLENVRKKAITLWLNSCEPLIANSKTLNELYINCKKLIKKKRKTNYESNIKEN